MPKNYTRKRSSTRRKRTYRRHKNRRGSKLLKQLRYFDHKLTGIIVVKADDLPSQQQEKTYVFSRFDYKGIIANVIGINSPPRWTQVRKNYEEYAVKGLSVKWIPTNMVGIDTGSQVYGQINQLWTYEDVDTYDIGGYTDT